jgi:hypothetical protein
VEPEPLRDVALAPAPNSSYKSLTFPDHIYKYNFSIMKYQNKNSISSDPVFKDLLAVQSIKICTRSNDQLVLFCVFGSLPYLIVRYTCIYYIKLLI